MATETVRPAGRRGAAARGAHRARAGRRWLRMARAVRRRAAVPVPLLLHAHRLAAGRAGHRPERVRAQPGQPHAAQLHGRSTARSRSAARWSTPGIFTGGVMLGTVVFGLLAGYALAQLRVPRQGRRVRERAAGPGRAVPAAHDPALRADRARLRAGRQLPRHDPAVRDQLDGGVRLPPVLPAAAQGAVRGGADRRRGRARDPAADRDPARASRRCSPRCC